MDQAPHIVMLVDNVIVGDSRVQKEAQAMAALGWRVTLVGRRMKDNQRRRGEVSGVRAHFVFVPRTIGSFPQIERTPRLRSPLAYGSARRATQSVASAELVLTDRTTAFDGITRTGAAGGPRWWRARVRKHLARLRRDWALRRSAATERVRQDRLKAHGRTDRIASRFWIITRRTAAWRRLDPYLLDWAQQYGPVVQRLKPDIIHANDHRMLLVGARAVERARARGRQISLVWDAHEWLPGLETSSAADNWLAAQVLVERAHAHAADRVVTVSDELASMLEREHNLPELPTVVCNAPITATTTAPETGLREAIGVDDSVRLLLYSGAVSPERGVDALIRALPHLPDDVHVAMVVRIPLQWTVEDLLTLADELGVRDRVHTAPYVPIEQIVPYLSGADIGIHTLHHAPNNEIALPTKFYEYANAGLPMVVSNVKVMGGTVRRLGIGEVFEPGDAEGLAAGVRAVLAEPERYRGAYETAAAEVGEWTWEAQARRLAQVYESLVGDRAPSVGDLGH